MPSPFTSRFILPAALALALAFAGCAVKKAGLKSGLYVVTSPTAEFFKYGPAQSFGPDLMLKRGDRVAMLEHTWGFCRVLTANGISGYVATEEIEPAPPSSNPRLVIAARGTGTPSGAPRMSTSSRQRRSEPLGNPNDPLFNVNDVPLPLPDDAPPKSKPQFRAAPPGPQSTPEPASKTKPKFRG